MADPWAILANSRVDVPGLLGVYQGARQSRMQDMLFQRQIANDDRKAELDIQRQGVMARLFQPKQGQQGGGDQSPQQPVSPAAVGAGMGQAMTPQAPQSLMHPAQLPPRTDGITLNPEALAALYKIDPEGAMQIQNTFYNAEKGQIERSQQNGETMYKAATLLQGMPQEQRAAVFKSMAPQLEQLGIPPDQLSQVDLSDQGLANYAQLGNTLANISDTRKPVHLGPGDEVQDPQSGTVLLQSTQPRLVTGANGEIVPLYPQGTPLHNGGRTAPPTNAGPQPGTIEDGHRFRGGDPGDPNNWEAVGGASPQGSRPFP